jgi:GntR family transcriptional repressor for pyruvate dehydrogenase complex
LSGTVSRMDGLTAPALTGIRRLSALDTVRARIALAVELGLLAPGERLPLNAEIAGALNVGEITVRRALVSLCEDGILERRRGRAGGTLVAAEPPTGLVRETALYTGSAAEVGALIDHRLALECGLVHLAAVRRDSADALHALVQRMDVAASWAEFHSLDAQFHLAVATASGLPTQRYFEVLQELYRYYLPYPIEYLRSSNQEHASLAKAIEAQDPLAAVEVTCQHVEALHHTMLARP